MTEEVGRDEAASWEPPNYPATSFRGTAEYYHQYRVPYPQELIEYVRTTAQLTGKGALLDLACGTGAFLLSMHTFFREIWAVDLEREMIEVGARNAEQLGVTNIRWIVGRAEDLEAAANSFELITIGSAFHRLDKKLIGERSLRWLSPGGCIAVMACNVAWKGKEEWQHVAAEVVAKWTDKRSMAPGKKDRFVPYSEVLRAIGYKDVQSRRFPTPYTWTLDSLVGFMYSTSKASKAVLGKHAAGFESDLRHALADYERNDLLHEEIDFFCAIGRKPKL